MKIRITREIVKEVDHVRRKLTVGQVVEIRDPDAASLIKHGYAEPFQDETPVVSVAAAAPAPEHVADALEEALIDDKPGKRSR